ncbi:MAG: hypothetical protein JXQ72_09725 [Anaerolineae bacterium]|nr:hypothetical protein [Anaerolineae bacterium]
MQYFIMRRFVSALVMISILTLAAPVQAQPGGKPAVLRIAMPQLGNLDPMQLSRFDPHTRDLVENLFVGLTRFNPQTRQIDPMLAESWTISADGLTWTFTLRQDIQWVHVDPATQAIMAVRPVAAGDVVYAIQRACDPLRPSPVTANLMIVRGCQTVAHAFPEVINDLFIAREMGVRATGPNTLEIDLLFPASYFPTLLSMPEFRPLPREAVAGNDNWTPENSIMTSGPYALQTQTASGMTLARNPYWPDTVAGNIENVEITFAAPSGDGSVDFVRLDPAEVAGIRAAAPDAVQTAPGSSLVMLGFAHERELTNNPDVRRALARSIDRKTLAAQLFPGEAQPLDQFTPPGVVAAPEAHEFGFDAAQAQTDFGAAGYTGCSDVPEKLAFSVPNDDPVWTQAGQAIAQQWIDHLGCNLALFEVGTLPRTLLIEFSHSTHNSEEITRSHAWIATWNADYPDANAWLNDALHCRYGYIRTGRACDEADDLLDQAALEYDPVRRAAIYAQVEEHFFGPGGTFPVVPLFISTETRLQQPWLTGVNEYGPARFDLWQIDTATQP